MWQVMTAIVEQLQFENPVKTESEPFDFQRERGNLIDAFIELDIAVAQWLKFLGTSVTAGQLFGQRIEKLAKHESLTVKAGKRQIPRIQELPERCSKLVVLRNALVHNRWFFGMKSGEHCVLCQNVADILEETPQFLAFTQLEIQGTTKELRSLARQLTGWLDQLNPASSPPPPSQAAAGGP